MKRITLLLCTAVAAVAAPAPASADHLCVTLSGQIVLEVSASPEDPCVADADHTCSGFTAIVPPMPPFQTIYFCVP